MSSFKKKEETNWLRTCRLLIEGGKELLLLYLQQAALTLYPSLSNFLVANYPKLLNLKRIGKLSETQYKKLMAPADTDQWDITLISAILRNLVKMTPREKKYADKIRELRNELYGHGGVMKMDDTEFNQNWQLIQQILDDAANNLLTNPHQFNLGDKTTVIQEEEVIDGEALRELLQSWQMSDVDLLDEVHQIKGGLESLQQNFAEFVKQNESHCLATDVSIAPSPGNHSRDTTVLECPGLNKTLNQPSLQVCGHVGSSAGLSCCQAVCNVSSNISDQQEFPSSDYLQSLQHGLIEYYRSNVIKAPVTVQGSGLHTHISDIYEEPRIVRIDHKATTGNILQENDGKNPPKENVITYEDIFMEQRHAKIYVAGIAGVGKTSFCKNLVAEWCSIYSSDGQKLHFLKPFRFLFYISLRHAYHEYDIRDMIISQLLNNITLIRPCCYGLKTRKECLDWLLLHHPEECLVILDGLDEWTSPCQSRYPSVSNGIPGRNPQHRYTVLTTSRPWKLESIRLDDTEIDLQIELTGVRSIKSFVHKFVQYFNSLKSWNTKKSYDDFLKQISETCLNNLERVPIVLKQLVCLWYEGQPFGKSYTDIYMNMLELLFKLGEKERNNGKRFSCREYDCGQSTRILPFQKGGRCDRYEPLLMSLGKLAFETLLSGQGQAVLVFNSDETECHGLSSQDLDTSLLVGLLTQSIVPNITSNQKSLSFLHKSFQEFCAAMYFASYGCNNGDLVKTICNHLRSVDDLFDIGDMLIFLGTMCPNLITQLTRALVAIINNDTKIQHERSSKFKFDIIYPRISQVQALILKICKESCENVMLRSPLTIPVPDIAVDKWLSESLLPTLSTCLISFPYEVMSFKCFDRAADTLPGILLVESSDGSVDTAYQTYLLDLTESRELVSFMCAFPEPVVIRIHINANHLLKFSVENVYSQHFQTIIINAMNLKILVLNKVKFCEHLQVCTCTPELDLACNKKLTSMCIEYTTLSNITLNDHNYIDKIEIRHVFVPPGKGLDLHLKGCRNLTNLCVEKTPIRTLTLNGGINHLKLDHVSMPHEEGLGIDLSVCRKLINICAKYATVSGITLNDCTEEVILEHISVPNERGLHLDLTVSKKLTCLGVKHTTLSGLTLNDCINEVTLEHVSVPNEQGLHLDLTVCKKLTYLCVKHTAVSGLTLNEYIIKLILDHVSVPNEQGLHIDLTVSKKLTYLRVKHTPVSGLTLNEYIDELILEYVSVPNERGLHLDLTVSKKLTCLCVQHTTLSGLTLNDCITDVYLEHVSVPNEQGLHLDLSVCKKLTYLGVQHTTLSGLTLNDCIYEVTLEHVSVPNEQGLHIDLAVSKKLTYLRAKHIPVRGLTLNEYIDKLILEYVSVPNEQGLHIDLTVSKKLTYLSVKHTTVSGLTLNDCINKLILEHVSVTNEQGLYLDLTVSKTLSYLRVKHTTVSGLTLNDSINKLTLEHVSVTNEQGLHLDLTVSKKLTYLCVKHTTVSGLTLNDCIDKLILKHVSVTNEQGLHIDLTVSKKLTYLNVEHTTLGGLTLNDCIDKLILEHVSVTNEQGLHLDLTVSKKLSYLCVKHTTVSGLTLNDCINKLILEHVSVTNEQGLLLDLTVSKKTELSPRETHDGEWPYFE